MSVRLSRGFAVLEIIVMIVFVGFVCVVGYVFYQSLMDGSATKSYNSSDQKQAENQVPEVQSTEDLDKVSDSLDAMDTELSDESDSSELNSEMSKF